MIISTLWLALLFAAPGLTVGSSNAGNTARVFIPFAFDVDGMQLPAGNYVIVQTNGFASVLLRAEAPTGASVAIEASVDRYAAGCACLRFHRYADGSYVLSDIHTGQGTPPLEVVSAMRKSRKEYPLAAVEIPLRIN